MSVRAITKDELEIPRSPIEMGKWVLSTLDQVAITLDGRNNIRLRKGLLKELADEALPIAHFSRHFFGDTSEVLIKHVIGSQSYDAEVIDQRTMPSGIRFIEVTQAREGESDYLRMLKLKQDGGVSGLGSVKKRGTKRTGLVIDVSNEPKSQSEILAEACYLIKKAIEKKTRIQYFEGTALIVSFNDFHTFVKEEDRANLSTELDREFVSSDDSFILFTVIGWSAHVYLEKWHLPS